MGYTSSTKVQRNFPGCRTTVYIHGTVTLATLFSDNAGTPLANPFTADLTTGKYQFFADDGVYDVQNDQGGIPSPFTLSSVPLLYPFTQAPGSTASYSIGTAWLEHPSVLMYPGVDSSGATTSTGLGAAFSGIATPLGGQRFFLPKGIYQISTPIQLDQSSQHWSNSLVEGASPFGSMLYQATGANINSPLFTGASGGSITTRRGFFNWGINGNWMDNPPNGTVHNTGVADCFQSGPAQDDLTVLFRFATYNCTGNGVQVPMNGYGSLSMLDLHGYHVGSQGSGVAVLGPGTEFKAISSLIAGNQNSGLELRDIGATAYSGLFNVHTSFATHYETDNRFGIYDENHAGLLSLNDFFLGTDNYCGPQALGCEFFHQMNSLTSHIAAPYGIQRDSIPTTYMFYNWGQGLNANRDKFPRLEDYMPLSAITDYNAENDGLGAFSSDPTRPNVCTYDKTPFTSSVTGDRYHRLSCPVADGGIVQTITTTVGQGFWFRWLFNAGVSALNLTSFPGAIKVQVRNHADNVLIYDSGPLTPGVYTAYRPDKAWETNFAATGTQTDISLICLIDQTVGSCLYTDLLLETNLLNNPGFENSLTGWTTSGPDCTTSGVAHTGNFSAYVPTGGSCGIAQIPTVVTGKHYVLMAWMQQDTKPTGSNRAVAWGNASVGSTSNGFFSSIRNLNFGMLFGNDEAGQPRWEKKIQVIRGDDFGNREVSWGSFGNASANSRIDDMALIPLTEAPQNLTELRTLVVDNGLAVGYGAAPAAGIITPGPMGLGTSAPLAMLHIVQNNPTGPLLILDSPGTGAQAVNMQGRTNGVNEFQVGSTVSDNAYLEALRNISTGGSLLFGVHGDVGTAANICAVLADNTSQGTGLYFGTACTITFATLSKLANGGTARCSDCSRTSPTAGAGTGALVHKEGGVTNGY